MPLEQISCNCLLNNILATISFKISYKFHNPLLLTIFWSYQSTPHCCQLSFLVISTKHIILIYKQLTASVTNLFKKTGSLFTIFKIFFTILF